MILLYCLNGVVITHGDDGPSAVAAEEYGDNVRVIPWPFLFGDLTKVGTPPDPDPVTGITSDSRPYAQPTETPQILLGYAAQVRYEVSVQGISFGAASGTIAADTNRLSQGLLASLAQYAATLQSTDTINFTQNNAAYTITAAEAIDLFNQVSTQIQNARNIEAACIADLTSPTPTILTYDDVDTRFAGARVRKKRIVHPQMERKS